MRIKTEIPLTLSLISKALNHTSQSDIKINAITTDSRLCEKNDLFIALPGKKYNGADFICEAKSKGAFVISEHSDADIYVDNAYKSLLKIAQVYKALIAPEYTIAITGSCGKTTVKDFLGILLSHTLNTHKTMGNYNNFLGVSHTVLTMPKVTDSLICEAGMNHIGEISEISHTVKPNISVITNIGTAHIGNLGSREMIAKAKLEIEDGMLDGKTVFFKEEPLLSKAKNPYFVSLCDKSADMYINILSRSEKGSEFIAKTASHEYFLKSKLSSLHTLNSLFLSVAVCNIMNFPEDVLHRSVASISEDMLRQKFLNINGYKIYDDSYNSSPEAVISALAMLSEREYEVSALIGDMLELGDKSDKLHEYIGRNCAKYKIKKLYVFGNFAKSVARGAILEGMSEDQIFINTSLERPDITASQIKETYLGERILVKASHSVKIYRVTDILKKGDC